MLPRVLSCLGLVLCLLWFTLTKRGFDDYVYWILTARELESSLGKQAVLVSRGGEFADGDRVSVLLEGRSRIVRMSWLSRQLTASLASYLAIAVFAVIYVTFLVVSVVGVV